MQSKATTVAAYLSSLPADRRAAIESVRKVILDNLDTTFEEGMQYGMIGYYVPHSVFPDGYHCDPKQPLPFAHLGSQKNHMALYLMGLYACEPEDESALTRWFRAAWAKAGKKLDMGKCCVRFKKLEDVPLDVVGELIRKLPAKTYLANCTAAMEAVREKGPRKATAKNVGSKSAGSKKAGSMKARMKQATAKKSASLTSATKKTVSKPATKKKAVSKAR